MRGPLLTQAAVDRGGGITATLEPIVAAFLGLAVVRFAAAFLRRFLGGRLRSTCSDAPPGLRRRPAARW
jgi:hypothetical protein